MKIQKHISQAIKDINHAIELETKEKTDEEIKFWLELMFRAGQVEEAKKHEFLNT